MSLPNGRNTAHSQSEHKKRERSDAPSTRATSRRRLDLSIICKGPQSGSSRKRIPAPRKPSCHQVSLWEDSSVLSESLLSSPLSESNQSSLAERDFLNFAPGIESLSAIEHLPLDPRPLPDLTDKSEPLDHFVFDDGCLASPLQKLEIRSPNSRLRSPPLFRLSSPLQKLEIDSHKTGLRSSILRSPPLLSPFSPLSPLLALHFENKESGSPTPAHYFFWQNPYPTLEGKKPTASR
eukprot:g34624.t1